MIEGLLDRMSHVCYVIDNPARLSKQAPAPIETPSWTPVGDPGASHSMNVQVRHARPRDPGPSSFTICGPSAVRLLTTESGSSDLVMWAPPEGRMSDGAGHRRCRISISLLPLELSALRGRCCPTRRQISDNSPAPPCSHLFSQPIQTFSTTQSQIFGAV